MKGWPKLFKTSSKGAEQEWEISVFAYTASESNEVWANIVTKHGQVGGAIQTAVVTVKKGKNLGKANATTAYSQAVSDAASKWTKQLDKGYSEQRGGNTEKVELLPMLAQEYSKRKSKVLFDVAYVQPKLDGVRALAVRKGDSILLLSRQGKEHKGLDHIRQALLKVMPDGDIWDGELYRHGMPFQKLVSLVKKPQSESVELQYHVYDAVAHSGFEDRFFEGPGFLLDEARTAFPLPPDVVRVPTHKVLAHSEVEAYHQLYVERGYEGAMLRWGSEGYKSGYRSEHLLKVKSFQEEDFLITDVVPGVGKEADKGTFVCRTDAGAVFHCRPRGSDEVRAEYLTKKDELIGTKLITRFFEWTTSDPPVPRFPVGISPRTYE